MKHRKHDIERYLRGELSPAEMHALERDALSDPFLAEALEGIEHAGSDNFLFDLHRVKGSVRDRMKTSKKTKMIRMWTSIPAVAATLLLIAISGFLIVLLVRQQQREVAKEESAVTQTADSLNVTSKDLLSAADSTEQTPSEADSNQPSAIAQSSPQLKPNGSDQPSETVADEGLIAAAPERDSRVEAPAGAASTRSERQLAAVAPDSIESLKISGRVSDDEGEAIAGVNVLVKGSSIGTITDAEGYYELDVPAADTVLQYAFIGYESKEMPTSSNSRIDVALHPDVYQLSEVVVTGAGVAKESRKKSSPVMLAEPEGGRDQYNDYLRRTVHYPSEAIKYKAEGRVMLQFVVEPNGQLTNFKIIDKIGRGCEEALMQAIKDGPAWRPTVKNNKPVRDKVSVGFRFELPE